MIYLWQTSCYTHVRKTKNLKEEKKGESIMKNTKINQFVMAVLNIIGIMAWSLGFYYILCTYTHVAFTFANVEMWGGCDAIAVVSVVIAYLFKKNRKEELAAEAAWSLVRGNENEYQ